jgi:hypothetical protein
MRDKRVVFPALQSDDSTSTVQALVAGFCIEGGERQRQGYHLHSEGSTLSIGYGAGEAVPLAASPSPPREHMVLDERGAAWIFPHRYDSALNSDRQSQLTGDVYGRPQHVIPPHSNYYRETYSFGGADGLTHYHSEAAAVCDLFVEVAGAAARQLFENRPLTSMSVLYGNLLLPGMEILLHADVPEFRGLSRKSCPSWLLCVMHHSDLFESHRVRSATCVSYYRPAETPGKFGAEGGELTVFHDGPERAARIYTPAHNSAVLLDTDSAFHAVGPCRTSPEANDVGPDPPPMPPGTVLRPADPSEPLGEWQAVCGREVVHRCGYEALRLSISCKFQCWCASTVVLC